MNGINHRGVGNLTPGHYDQQGLTFFTRPNLNLTYDNVLASRRLSFMGYGNREDMANSIRCLLSPNIEQRDRELFLLDGGTQLPRSPIVDDRMPFIPILTNTMLSNTGWNDTSTDAFSTKEGLRREVIGWSDGYDMHYGEWDLNTTFQNIDGDPVTSLITAWIIYPTLVKYGTIAPYPKYIIQNRIDYNTKVYRIILDRTKTYVRKLITTIAWPNGINDGSAFNYSAEQAQTEGTENINVRWKCYGTRVNDPRDIINFNQVMNIFNPAMRDRQRPRHMIKLLREEVRMFNYKGYPHISPTHELEWYVELSDYYKMYGKLNITPPPEEGRHNVPKK